MEDGGSGVLLGVTVFQRDINLVIPKCIGNKQVLIKYGPFS